ncbi:MAG: kynureninase [Caulobacteraceae bacterium]|nr:kynureninase [Caulobacteraceae bacterium]
MTTRDDCLALDAADPLAPFRAEFDLPEGVIYLDGNSLGALPRATGPRLQAVVAQEWGRDLIRSWNTAGWIDAPARVGGKIAGLVGARPHEVTAADSTSANLFKLVAGALSLRPGRKTILSEPGNFPTDLYVIQGLAALLGEGVRLKTVPADELVAAIDEDVAVVVLTEVHYKTGRRWPMKAVTAAAHAAGALMLWDLSHSAGAVAVDLNGADADLAVGCGYKYLNGGPGAPAFLFVAERHQAAIRSPLTGWMGHADPFAFVDAYAPAPGVRRQLCGTPPILGLSALEVGVDLHLRAPLAALEAKGKRLGDLFIELVEARCGFAGLTLASPRDAAGRGSHVSYAHADGYAMMQALIARGVIGDFRAPDILRFGFTPLYVGYADVWDAVEILRDVLETRAYDQEDYRRVSAVT